MIERVLNELNVPLYWQRPVALLLWLLVIYGIGWFIKRQITSTNLGNDVQYKAKKAVTFGTYLFFVIVVVVVYSASMSGISVALGVAGVGIAFALQEVIMSFAGWLALLFGNFYKPGDRVQLGGIRGDVIDIGVLRTTLMETGEWVDGDLYSGRIVRIANSFVFKEPVFNYSSDFPFLWDEIKIPIHHGCNIAFARDVFQKVANDVTGEFAKEATVTWSKMTNKYRVENARTEAFVTLVANDNWIEFTIRYTVNYKRRRITRDQLYTSVLEEIAKSDGRVRLASTTIELTKPSLNDSGRNMDAHE